MINIFKKLDTDSSGVLETDELKAYFKEQGGGSMSDDEINEVVKNIDKDNDGKINY